MKHHFCTLFNSAYLSRGLVLYESLSRCSPSFHLYVFAFDEAVVDYFKKNNLANLTVISLKEFEDEQLLAVKPTRSAGEYCWTCTASTIRYCLNKFNLDACTYLDADMCFYSDPAVLIEEMGAASVLITAHRYSPAYDQSLISGKYCVQFVTFKNTSDGLKVLNKWRQDCLDWCYARVEDGKFGDQKYLDYWPGNFEGVHELRNLGGGLAPWNIQQYRFTFKDGKISGEEIVSGTRFEPVFFHFHGLKFYTDDIVSYTDVLYEISPEIKELFYAPYVKELNAAKARITATSTIPDAHGAREKSPGKPFTFLTLLMYYLYDLGTSGKFFGQGIKARKLHHHFYPNK